MLKYIYGNKLKYNKGQLAPFFIAVLVIVIIMAMVTLNLGKIGSIKTDSSNAADAGAISGGSIMAGVFNGQAVMNSSMMVAHQTFLANLAVSIALTAYQFFRATSACSQTPCVPDGCGCCCPCPGCKIYGTAAIVSIISIYVATFFHHISQIGFFHKMQEAAEKGRGSAIKAAFSYAFGNSGIGGKLIEGKPPEDPEEMRGDEHNYRDTYRDFLKDELSKECGVKAYPWTDGQNRPHNVEVEVETQKVDLEDYILKVSIFCMTIITVLDYLALDAAWQIPALCLCCPAQTGNIAALGTEATLWLLAAWAGLFPGPKMPGSSCPFKTPCWVDDIDHDRLFTVRNTQTHGRYEYSLWTMEYPSITSKSRVSFEGNGKIYKPKPKFDASIVSVDTEVQ